MQVRFIDLQPTIHGANEPCSMKKEFNTCDTFHQLSLHIITDL